MHVFQFAFYVSGLLYAIFVDYRLIFYFLSVVGIYVLISIILPGAKSISARKKLMLNTWSPPSEGIVHNSQTIRVEKVQKLLEEYPKQSRPTITHFIIKATGELLKKLPDINGRLVFGKFVPYETQDVCCLVDIEGGKDLAFITVRDVGNKGVEDIADFIKEKAGKMKKSGGGTQHKKRNGPFHLLPAFLTTFFVQGASFVSSTLGISIGALGIEKNPCGAALVTSLGMLGLTNATAPFSGPTNSTILVSANAVQDAPVVEDGKIVVGKVMNVNFVVDHRYLDGGQTKHLIPAFYRVFEHPEEFLRASLNKKQE